MLFVMVCPPPAGDHWVKNHVRASFRSFANIDSRYRLNKLYISSRNNKSISSIRKSPVSIEVSAHIALTSRTKVYSNKPIFYNLIIYKLGTIQRKR